jgi:hypothetical protein
MRTNSGNDVAVICPKYCPGVPADNLNNGTETTVRRVMTPMRYESGTVLQKAQSSTVTGSQQQYGWSYYP